MSNTVPQQSRGVRQDRHNMMQLKSWEKLKLQLCSYCNLFCFFSINLGVLAKTSKPRHFLYIVYLFFLNCWFPRVDVDHSHCLDNFTIMTPETSTKVHASLALSRLLFTVYQLSDRKESVHSWELWDTFAANCHPSAERNPGKACTTSKNTPTASSSATCHLKVTTGQFATWTTCYLCSF